MASEPRSIFCWLLLAVFNSSSICCMDQMTLVHNDSSREMNVDKREVSLLSTYSLLKRPDSMDDSDEGDENETAHNEGTSIEETLMASQHSVLVEERKDEDLRETALHKAVKEGAFKTVTALIASGANVNARTKGGNTPLHLAAQAGNEEIVIALLAANAWACIQNNEGALPRYYAIEKRHTKIVNLLESASASEKIRSADFRQAIKEGKRAHVENYLKMKVNLEEKESILCYTTRFGRIEIVELFLKAGADVNGFDRDGCTPLHNAIVEGHRELIVLLLDHGANINAENYAHETPLHLAAARGRSDIVKLLLQCGASYRGASIRNECTYNGYNRTQISLAASAGDYEMIALLWLRGVSINCQKGLHANSPLHWAVLALDVKMAAFLLDCGAWVNARNSLGYTPLHLAVHNDDIATIKLLVNKGAEIEAVTTEGLTPLHIAVSKGNLKAFRALIIAGASTDTRSDNGITPFDLAVNNNQFTLARFLYLYNREKNNGIHIAISRQALMSLTAKLMQVKNHFTLLNEVAENGDIDKVRSIVKKNPLSLLQMDSLTLLTPLQIAIRNEHVEMIEYMIEAGSRVDGVALKMAIDRGNPRVLLLVLGADAKIAIPDELGENSIHWAAHRGSAEIMRMVISAGAPVDATNRARETALHIAARNGNVWVARVLIHAGADLDLADNDGKTALHVASEKSHDDFVQMLIGEGCDVNRPDNLGKSAFMLRMSARHPGCSKGCLDTLKLFLEVGAEIDNSIFSRDLDGLCVFRPVLIFQILGKKKYGR